MPDSSLPPSAFEALQLPAESVAALTNDDPPNSSNRVSSINQETSHGSEHASCANSTSITLYAELLLNIRTVTLFASLRTVHNHETKATLLADSNSISVCHEGESASIQLPTTIKGGGDAALHLPSQPPSKELTLRLQLEEKEGMKLLERAQSGDREANYVPWDAPQLNGMEDVQILCKQCDTLLICHGSIQVWKDLPNENWAEMMDFWHCHKPHDHGHAQGEFGNSKGYAAGNRLKAVRSQGFVDLCLLLVEKDDCENIKVVGSGTSRSDRLVCGTCNARIGSVDEGAQGWRFWKWALTIHSSPPSAPSTFEMEKWIAAHVLTLIENEGVRKFSVRAEDDGEQKMQSDSLLLWIFTPDLSFSSSIPSKDGWRDDPTRAMKVFWQSVSTSLSTKRASEQQSFSVEEVTFPANVVAELTKALEQSQSLLPENARQFQGWHVGLLKRFDSNGQS